jgi:hypothetical protein
MYDKETMSLWNTLMGEPVVGPLADSGIQLERRAVVTTTWGAWKKKHPETTVLSLKTGHRRNYDEGVAYAEYFGSDEVMFNVPSFDNRIKKNKAEVLSLIIAPPKMEPKPVAVAISKLAAEPVVNLDINGVSVVILTDPSGANRVYERGSIAFKSWNGETAVIDSTGQTWTVSEDSLTHDSQPPLYRLPAHRAFWFGWINAFPGAELIQ